MYRSPIFVFSYVCFHLSFDCELLGAGTVVEHLKSVWHIKGMAINEILLFWETL